MAMGEPARPGLRIHTVDGDCALLHPKEPGNLDGDWIAVFDNGLGVIVSQEQIQAHRKETHESS